jgi:hypothetical protein
MSMLPVPGAGETDPRRRLCLSPQCGFSSAKEGNDLTAEQERAELALVVETAQEVWGR